MQTCAQSGLKGHYRGLFFKFLAFSIICASIPLFFIASHIHDSYFEYSNQKMLVSLQKRIESNKDIIDDYFRERLNDLRIITQLYSYEYLQNENNLRAVFDIFNADVVNYDDLGVINSNGFHDSYVGPYDLMRNDYSVTFWFKELANSNCIITDMFLGYRNIPHIIIAVKKVENGKKWILRATINTNLLHAKLRRLIIGGTGQAFLLSSMGLFQVCPGSEEKVMQKSFLRMSKLELGSGVRISGDDSPDEVNREIIAYSWLANPNWVLIMRQNYQDFFWDRTYADRATLTFFGISAFSILLVVTASVAYIVRTIRNRDTELGSLNQQLVQTGKLAAIGQLAAGVAHEINNPLAVIQSEIDLMRVKGISSSLDQSFVNHSFDQIETQVERCGKITTKLLRFSRRVKSDDQPVDLNENIKEVTGLFERWASAAGIEIRLDLEEDLPKIQADSLEIGQVLVNLVGNAIDAHKRKESGSIHITTRAATDKGVVHITVSDSGEGIPPENIKFIFDPFFTTKAADKGTGLGLSIAYSIMKNLGGEITVQSELAKGTEFMLRFPIPSSQLPIGRRHAMKRKESC